MCTDCQSRLTLKRYVYEISSYDGIMTLSRLSDRYTELFLRIRPPGLCHGQWLASLKQDKDNTCSLITPCASHCRCQEAKSAY